MGRVASHPLLHNIREVISKPRVLKVDIYMDMELLQSHQPGRGKSVISKLIHTVCVCLGCTAARSVLIDLLFDLQFPHLPDDLRGRLVPAHQFFG